MGKLGNAACGACEYYKPSRTESMVEDFGECRRFPSAVIVDGGKVVGKFPLVDETDWCGDFSETERPAAHNRDADGHSSAREV